MSILIGWLSTFFLRHHSPYINLLSTVSWTVSSECGKSRRSAFRILFGTPSVGGFILRSDRADAEAHPGLVALGEAWGETRVFTPGPGSSTKGARSVHTRQSACWTWEVLLVSKGVQRFSAFQSSLGDGSITRPALIVSTPHNFGICSYMTLVTHIY